MEWYVIDLAQDEDQHGNEPSGSIYRWKILKYVHTWVLSSVELAGLQSAGNTLFPENENENENVM